MPLASFAGVACMALISNATVDNIDAVGKAGLTQMIAV